MKEELGAFYELTFRAHFLVAKAAAFQDLFYAVMSKAYPDDFIPCRPWGNLGDRKNDGYLRSERTLFQVYAPNEIRAADTILKIEVDFEEALLHWRDYFDTWVFVHNSQAGLPPNVIAKLLAIQQDHPSIHISHWGYEELLLRFRMLTPVALRSLYGSPPPVKKTEASSRDQGTHDFAHSEDSRVTPQLDGHESATTVSQSVGLPSAVLKERIDLARAATRRHEFDSALRLWEDVAEQAVSDQNRAEELRAKLETVVILAQDGDSAGALSLAEQCLTDVNADDLSARRSHLLQLLGEVHRLKGNSDLARGFLAQAIEAARVTRSLVDEGFALLSMSALESDEGSEDRQKALDIIDLSYRAFTGAYAEGDADQKKKAKDGFAQCHCWKAEIFGQTRPDDALTEWTRALTTFQDLGEGWENLVAETLLNRAKLLGRIGEIRSSVTDLDAAAKIFGQVDNSLGLANCHLFAGELLDQIGKRSQAEREYYQAGCIAAKWGNDRRGSYFYFRYACKLVELGRHDEAMSIFTFLANAPWLERNLRITVVSQLSLVASHTEDEAKLHELSTVALTLIDESLKEEVSPDKRRRLLIDRGHHLSYLGDSKKALQQFKEAIRRFEIVGDRDGVIECWFHIRGLMQKLGDREKEREASNQVLLLGGETSSPMLAALALVGLAQLNIGDQKYREARSELDRAIRLAPDNPVVSMMEADLRRKLPHLTPIDMMDAEHSHQSAEGGIVSLLHELDKWCSTYPRPSTSALGRQRLG